MVGNLQIPNPINATNGGDLLNPNPFVHVTNGGDLLNPNPLNVTNGGDLLNPNPFNAMNGACVKNCTLINAIARTLNRVDTRIIMPNLACVRCCY